MSGVAVTLSSIVQNNSQRIQAFYFDITVSGAYVAGGIPLDSVVAAVVQPQAVAPKRIILTSKNGSGYTYQRHMTTGLLQIFVVGPSGSPAELAGGPLVEIPAGTVPTAVSNDVIDVCAEYNRNVG